MSEKSFPLRAEILSAVPKGRVPYIELNISLAEIASVRMSTTRERLVSTAIASFAKSDLAKVPEPPLPESLSNILPTANNSQLVTYRRRTEEDALRNGDDFIVTRDSTQEGIVLLQTIADYGRSPL